MTNKRKALNVINEEHVNEHASTSNGRGMHELDQDSIENHHQGTNTRRLNGKKADDGPMSMYDKRTRISNIYNELSQLEDSAMRAAADHTQAVKCSPSQQNHRVSHSSQDHKIL
jgi:hypothetical protein